MGDGGRRTEDCGATSAPYRFRGATGSDLIATVDCHSSFLLPCCPPPWTNIPPRQFSRDPASSYQPTTQSPSFHQPRHTLHFSILSILLILSKNLYTFYTAEIGYWQGDGLTTEDGGQRMGDGRRRTEDCGATSAPYRFRVSRGSILCVLCVLLDHRSLGEGGCG